jgi:hypothetical protein
MPGLRGAEGLDPWEVIPEPFHAADLLGAVERMLRV